MLIFEGLDTLELYFLQWQPIGTSRAMNVILGGTKKKKNVSIWLNQGSITARIDQLYFTTTGIYLQTMGTGEVQILNISSVGILPNILELRSLKYLKIPANLTKLAIMNKSRNRNKLKTWTAPETCYLVILVFDRLTLFDISLNIALIPKSFH